MIEDNSARPQAWAQTLLALIVDPADHDAIAGDLLEQFRDEQVPARGLAAARRWYAGQVAASFWRSTRVWIALLALCFVAGDMSNQFRRPDGTPYLRMYVPIPFVAALVFLTVGFLTGRRSRSIVAGLLTAAAIQTALLSFMVLWWNATLFPVAQLIQNNPYWINAWHYSGNGQSFLVWSFYDNLGAIMMATLVLLPAATVLGATGALVGKLTRR